MDFDKAEPEGAASSVVCAICGTPPQGVWFQANGQVLCERCAAQVRAVFSAPPPLSRWFKAMLFGSVAAVAGAVGYGAIIYYAQVELALITILIGWVVGRAVMIGADHRGGLGLQLASAVLTWLSCTMAFVPSLIAGAMSGAEGEVSTVAVTLTAMIFAPAFPFLGGLDILSLLILAFGVWQGFQGPREVAVEVLGPFGTGARQAAP